MESPIRLVKQTKSFKITVTENLEKIIRFLCDKLPNNEYSGTLFYKVEGSFEEGDLHIIAKDFYLQDVGTGGYTEFKNDATMAGYMVEKGLFDCYQGLMHSHNRMATFFSGTDTNTLLSEGQDTNHFVSLIVNNAGIYSAAITRKITRTIGSVSYSYNTFNNVPVNSTQEDINTETVIEYFPLAITIESIPENSLAKRLELLQKAQSSSINRTYSPQNVIFPPKENYRQLTLFDKEETTPFQEIKNDDYNEVHFDSKVIARQAAQIITGNVFASFNPNIDLKKWVVNMSKVYEKRFKDFEQFKYFADCLVDFFLTEVNDDKILEALGSEDEMYALWADELTDAITKYGTNEYIEYYIKTLTRF